MIVLYVVVALVVIVGLAYILIYNGLVGARNKVDEAWSGIDVQLKRRHDLVPNLVAAVKGYAEHERSTLDAVVEARSAAQSASGPAAQGAAENRLTGAIGPVLALAEQYPQLRAVEGFTRLQDELAQLEDEIQAARRLYNGNVQSYTTKTQVFPSSIVAARGPFPPKELFALSSPAEREVPSVDFGA
ncbi:Protein LemA [Paraconexibacter sp. AEG42_29]|uniref:Protein LemA n=1 Tax=Paraconexibacter sp. AEG42_29 TaxID=2997339 RepID=A0AAU7B2W4_9ACTN